jgi:hypothetical protein
MKKILVIALLTMGLGWGGAVITPTITFATSCGFALGKSLCLGDKNCDCDVTIDELVYFVGAAQYGGDFCSINNPVCDSPLGINVSHGDRDCNWQISIDELTQMVNASQNGCKTPCYSGLDYPINIGGTLCTGTIFRNNHCGGVLCTHAQCPACP